MVWQIGLQLPSFRSMTYAATSLLLAACGPILGDASEGGKKADSISIPPLTGTTVDVAMTSGQMNTWRCGWMNFDLDGDTATLLAGEPVTDAYLSWGVSISVVESDGVTPGVAAIFDSSNPTGGDSDLGTPSAMFGGPGVGNGGWSNSNSLYGLLIKAENTGDADGDGLIDDPDDDASGGWFHFDFAEDMCVQGTKVIDIEANEAPAHIVMKDAAGMVVGERWSSNYGNNSAEYIALGECGVRQLKIGLASSGAIDGTGICAGTPRSYQIEVADDFDDVRFLSFDVETFGKDAGGNWQPLASRNFQHYPHMLSNGGPLPDAPLIDNHPPPGQYSKVRVRLGNVETIHFDGTVVSHPSTPFAAIPHAFVVPSCGNLDLDLDYELNVRTGMDLQEIALGLEFLAASSATSGCGN